MSIKRYTSNQDTTITNAYRSNLVTRGTGSNMGASDVMEVFSIFAQASSASVEASRILVKFPVDQISSDRNAGKIPGVGNVNFILKAFNAPHGETLPRQFTLVINPVSSSWQEGTGLDMEEYTNVTRNGDGANWLYAASGSTWITPGGDYLPTTFSQSFDQGFEDLEVDITSLVEQWMSGSIANYGVGIMLTGSQENQGRSFYTKKFFTRTSEFFFKRPTIEARWNSSTQDDRQRFFASSSLLSSTDNTHTIYLYNYVGGQLKNIPSIGTGQVFVQVYTSGSDGDVITTIPSPVTGGYVSTGVYSASFVLDTTASVVYDRWFAGPQVFHTGTIRPIAFDAMDSHAASRRFVSSLTNLKSSYSIAETSRIRMFTRPKDWNPNIYTVASNVIENTIIDNVYYKLLRITDNNTIIDYGTGSLNHTKLSYDSNGNFFDFNMSMLEPGHSYGFRFVFLIDDIYEEQAEIFKFRVEDV